MKKLRGKKRYFRNLWEEVNSYDLKLDHESWFDFWHIHLDFFGFGNNSKKIRREHIKAHVALYNRLLQQLEAFDMPYQTWICIHEKDSFSDAVYVHTPNPNDDYFPHQIEELEWNCKLPNAFKDLIDLDQFDVAYYKSKYEEVYFIQSKEQGIKL
ncbi:MULTISPECIES: hypothetical protein [Bacillus]|uniref:hypothetical protein n=2 Tax=Bacillus TaxID=1386 RepID=UPI001582FBC4|nr:hypothetical protein [Bacillus glycinifermentans]MBU8785510.1 hypothetical protein [Bacillus glycinifermentans]NUJ15829.1 hypothetical protein [Bacillus glycinifermentans]